MDSGIRKTSARKTSHAVAGADPFPTAWKSLRKLLNASIVVEPIWGPETTVRRGLSHPGNRLSGQRPHNSGARSPSPTEQRRRNRAPKCPTRHRQGELNNPPSYRRLCSKSRRR
ncbi:hypothetical protein HPB47_008593 [Ixodes persulcatus]|uniref:Uncharacterized protein n=1 Tax=Ixodes persulcatus TaxID=34615 RepID=A0AC60P4J4_IXOPE|nr:hypothetical protein HPB47_008593 [Ixodes persulcatus]